MRNNFTLLFSILFGVLAFAGTGDQNEVLPANLPQSTLKFRKNLGQWDDPILYKAEGARSNIYFMNNGLSFGFRRGAGEDRSQGEILETLVWNLEFLNSSRKKQVTAEGKTDSKTNYILGNNPIQYYRNVPEFDEVTYEQIYKGIDLRYFGQDHDLKYDFILHSGATPDQIKMRADGINGLNVSRNGELEILTDWGVLLEEAPYSYQVINGVKKEVDIRFEIYNKDTYGFKLYGEYDKNHDLVIDPVILKYSTFVGGSQSWSYVFDNTIDNDRYLYASGYAISDFPTTPGAYNVNPNDGSSNTDVFIFKLKPDGSDLEWATFVGGTGGEYGYSIEINDKKEVFVTGDVSSNNFPISAGAYKPTYQFRSGYVLKLNAAGNNLEYSTYVYGFDKVHDLALNKKDEVFITGYGANILFESTPGAFQTKRPGGEDAMVLRLNAKGTAAIYATFLGGNTHDRGLDIEVNDNDEAYVTGYTYGSSSFPTTNGVYQKTPKSGSIMDAFVTKLKADGSGLVFSTRLGGSDVDRGHGIDIDASGAIYLTGSTDSDDFPTTAGAYQSKISTQGLGKQDIFISKLSPDAKTLIYSTYVGGATYPSTSWGTGQLGTGIAVSSKGEAFVTGWTQATDYPTTTACNNFTSYAKWDDCFVIRLDTDGSMLFSGLFGGQRWDYGGVSARASISIYEDACGEVEAFVTTTTHSSDFPTTTGAFQETKLNGEPDQPVAFLLKPVIDPDFKFTTPQCSQPVSFTDMTTGNCVRKWSIPNWNPTSWEWDFGDGTKSTQQHPTHMYAKPGTYEVKLRVTCPEDSIVKTVVIPNPFFTFELGADMSICPEKPINITLDAGKQPAGVTYKWNDGATTQTKTVTSAGKYWVTISNGSCSATDTLEIKSEKMGGSVESVKPSCSGAKDGEIKALPTGGTPPYNYQWSNGQLTQTATGLGAGQHTITVTDKNGCEMKATLTLNEPTPVQPTITPIDAGCSGNDGSATATAKGGNGPYTYSWSNGSTGASVSNLNTGDHSVTVTDINGCKVTENFTINQQPSPIQVNLTLKQDADCSGQGGSATVTPAGGSGPYTYSWSSGQSSRTVTDLSAGSYKVTVTDVNGCVGDLVVDIQSSGSLDAQISSSTVHGCDRSGGVNAEATVTATGGAEPYNYEWSNGETTATATGLAAGKYTVKVTDQGGCTSTASVTIDEIMPLDATVVIDPSCATCADGEATVQVNGGSAPYTYRWNDDNQQTTATATGLKPGIYVVTVTDNKDCRNTDTVNVGNVTSVEDPGGLNSYIGIYPNPNNGKFMVDVNLYPDEYILIRIFDITGKQVLQDRLTSGLNNVTLDRFTKGIYLMEISIGKQRITKRVQVL